MVIKFGYEVKFYKFNRNMFYLLTKLALLCQGELALAFGELLRKLWAHDRTPVTPRLFKTKLSHFAPQFSGFNQHDSQVSGFFYF